MKHILIGYGYAASFLAKTLLKQTNDSIQAYARSEKQADPSVSLIATDVSQQGIKAQTSPFHLYYFIAPQGDSDEDTLLSDFISQLDWQFCQSITYISSTGVYGDHHGAWVNESSACLPTTNRQKQRLHAEQLMTALGKCHHFPVRILRCAGIYGPNRLPIEAAINQTPVLETEQAPYSSLIYVYDLAAIMTCLTNSKGDGIINLADGEPKPMGNLQQTVASIIGHAAAPTCTFESMWAKASIMKRFFMQNNKRIGITKLRTLLPCSFELTLLEEAIRQSLQEQGVSIQ